MGRVEVIDHIKPIREAPPGVKTEIESYEGIMDLAAKFKEKKAAEEPLDLRVMDLPQIEAESVSESDEDEEADRGVFHREVSAGDEPTSVFRETAHPVSIEGKQESKCTRRILIRRFRLCERALLICCDFYRNMHLDVVSVTAT